MKQEMMRWEWSGQSKGTFLVYYFSTWSSSCKTPIRDHRSREKTNTAKKLKSALEQADTVFGLANGASILRRLLPYINTFLQRAALQVLY